MFTFDIEKEVEKAGAPPANPANPANHGAKLARLATLALAEARIAAKDAPGTLPDPAAEARRQRLLTMLERDPEVRYAVLTADNGQGQVIVAIGLRDTATAEYKIERTQYDGMLLLELIERHSGTIH